MERDFYGSIIRRFLINIKASHRFNKRPLFRARLIFILSEFRSKFSEFILISVNSVVWKLRKWSRQLSWPMNGPKFDTLPGNRTRCLMVERHWFCLTLRLFCRIGDKMYCSWVATGAEIEKRTKSLLGIISNRANATKAVLLKGNLSIIKSFFIILQTLIEISQYIVDARIL